MEQQLKQRLVGAIVLVSLAVIFIPVILEGPDDEWAPRTHDIPAPPELDYRASMDLPIPATAQPAPQDSAAGQAATSGEPAEPVPAPAQQEEDKIPPVPEPAPEPPPAPARTPASAPAASLAPGWYAQLGSFTQRSNASSLRGTLARTGVSVHIQVVDTGKGSIYRVLAGPEPDRTRAEVLLRKLGQQLKTTGIVTEIGAGG
jgi:DedD protein